MVDHKVTVILALSVVVIVLLGFVSVNGYNNKKEAEYNRGVQDGALLQQQNIIRSVQATGFVSMNLGVNEDGQSVSVVLAPVQQQQQAQQQV
tara:strand:- start:108 stop:383 length:276 start_codon:yes stop_codon:yes gene_type:complete